MAEKYRDRLWGAAVRLVERNLNRRDYADYIVGDQDFLDVADMVIEAVAEGRVSSNETWWLTGSGPTPTAGVFEVEIDKHLRLTSIRRVRRTHATNDPARV